MNFRNPSGGPWYLRGLFYETTLADKSTVLYTLKDQDHEGYKSLYRLYLEMEDLLEYDFANTHLGGWEHWQQLCNTTWFEPYITRWREELELKVRTEALRTLREDAKSSSRSAAASNRFLLEKGWAPKVPGRPTKQAVKDEAQKRAKLLQSFDDDYARITNIEKTVQ